MGLDPTKPKVLKLYNPKDFHFNDWDYIKAWNFTFWDYGRLLGVFHRGSNLEAK